MNEPLNQYPRQRKHIRWYHPAFLLSTWFGLGKIPFLPGTMGSLGALPFAWIIQQEMGSQVLLTAALTAFLVGIAAIEVYMKSYPGEHDRHEIVIDEVAGQWLLLAALPHTVTGYAIGFFLFRLLDMWKPWPIKLFDDHIPGSYGVMADDIVAAAIPAFLISLWVYSQGHDALWTLLGG